MHRKCGRPLADIELEEEACLQAKGWGECPADRRSAPTVASSLSASSARPTSCPCRRPQRIPVLLLKRVGKCGDRVLVVRRGGSTAKATRPQGVLTLARQKEPTGDSSQTLLPGSAGSTSADAQESLPAALALGVGPSFSARLPGCPVLPPLAHSRPQLSQ